MDETSLNKRRNPAWAREEIILVAEAVAANSWHELRTGDAEARELSKLLQKLDIHPVDARPHDFRSPGSVSRKTSDIMTAHSAYSGVRTKGGALTREVVQEFESDPSGMVAQAEYVRERATEGGALPSSGRVVDPDLGVPASEGGVRERAHLARERDKRIRKAKINAVRAAGGAIECEVCGFNFGAAYGNRGHGYIEVHHRVPLHVSGPTETSLADLALLCSNCHRMIHRAHPWLTVEQLSEIASEGQETS
ncbi:HNH endonuclease [Spelaeicoccus albus]|uniref:HNH domain-containing protein n=1 Tax=Spelaeicoccus albus TaxID=1280376 RepID=A0A7Z0D1H8_9MICO|nr:HNH endonuclease [Spelaeicoccus albus]NYI66115.1 hypothetical protein [Spelaeicoccus albus]